VALLRGINVGGRNRVAMAELRAVVEALGHTDVATHIQSGNVVFTARDAAATQLAGQLEQVIADRLGLRPRVVVLGHAELAEVVAANPFPGETDPRRLHAALRPDPFPPAVRDAVLATLAQARHRGSTEDVRVVGRTAYLHTPEGVANSAVAALLARPATAATARNWGTVTKLLALLRA